LKRLRNICTKENPTLVMWQLLLWKRDAEMIGASFEFEHRFSIIITWQDQIFQIKINALDREFFVIGPNEEIVKMFRSVSEMKTWFTEQVLL